MILGGSLKRNALVYRDKPAIVEPEGRTLTHGQLADRVFRLANAFLSAGLSKSTNVAIIARNSAAYLETYFACGVIGACVVPINFHLGKLDVERRLAHSESRAIIIDLEFLPLLDNLPAGLVDALQGRIYLLGDSKHGSSASPIRIEAAISGAPTTPPEISVHPEDPLYIGYTSGTTGPPKGAVISHRAIVVGFLYKALECALDESDVNYDPGPFWHSAPRDFASLAVYLGGTAIVTRNFEPREYMRVVDQYRVTNSFLVPTMLQMLSDTPMEPDQDLSSLRLFISAGSPLPTSVKERIIGRFGPILFESYGATETRMITSIKADELRKLKRCVGRATRDVEICVVDPNGAAVENGTVGEIFVKGPGLFTGYFNDPEQTRLSHRGAWFSLGDMGRMDDDGYLYLVDRKQDMIISGGENIFPNDIEEVVAAHPGVKEVTVIGTPHRVWGEQVTAIVVPKSDAPVNVESVLEFAAARLPSYMKPRRVEFIDELPRNPTGKVLRAVLREHYRKDER